MRVAATAQPSVGIARIEVRGFRNTREVSVSPGLFCTLVGETIILDSNRRTSDKLVAAERVLNARGVAALNQEI